MQRDASSELFGDLDDGVWGSEEVSFDTETGLMTWELATVGPSVTIWSIAAEQVVMGSAVTIPAGKSQLFTSAEIEYTYEVEALAYGGAAFSEMIFANIVLTLPDDFETGENPFAVFSDGRVVEEAPVVVFNAPIAGSASESVIGETLHLGGDFPISSSGGKFWVGAVGVLASRSTLVAGITLDATAEVVELTATAQ